MDIARFKDIIKYSQVNRSQMEANVRDLYARLGMTYERELLDVMQVVRPLLTKKGYFIVELPIKDKEIGALCYKGDSMGYTLLNSSLPRVNVNFALCHEIYHIFYQEIMLGRHIELYMNEHYFDYQEEYAANLFAGMLLMPEQSYRMMFTNFKQDNQEEDGNLSIIIKLMNYFKVPYMAALIRCYELDLLEAGENLAQLLNVGSESIREEFMRLWLDESLLAPTYRDDFRLLHYAVAFYGKRFSEEELISDATVEKVLHNIKELYQSVKGD